MSTEAFIRIRYPVRGGRLALRTEADWSKDLRPVAMSPDGTRLDFRMPLGGARLRFRPVLKKNGKIHWSLGACYVATPGAGRALSLYPCFLSRSTGGPPGSRIFRSRAAAGDYAVRVFHPPGYDENTLESYPVLYMHGAQDLIFPDGDVREDVKLRETLKLLGAMSAIRKALVVGIRPRARRPGYGPAGLRSYGRFVVEELKPWVDATFRTLRGRRHTATIGSSLHGVASLYLGWEWSEVFGQAACLSGRFGAWDGLIDRVVRDEKKDIRVYLDSGWPQGGYEEARRMRAALLRKGFEDGRDLLYYAFPEDGRDGGGWVTRAQVPYRFFFGRPS